MAKNIRSVEAVLLLFILLLSACLALTAPGFLSWQNFFDLLNQNAVKMIFATGLVVVLIIGGIDISFAAAAVFHSHADGDVLNYRRGDS